MMAQPARRLQLEFINLRKIKAMPGIPCDITDAPKGSGLGCGAKNRRPRHGCRGAP